MQTPADLIHFSRNMKSFIKGGENVTITGEGTEQFPLIISSTGDEGIQSIVEGDNISVDNTDPSNPIVSVSGIVMPEQYFVEITEGVNTGYGTKYRKDNPGRYGDIGANAIDLSFSTFTSSTVGARGQYSTVSGQNNTASGNRSVVSGGSSNTSSGDNSIVSGGHGNTASGQYSTVSGGQGNTANGIASTVSGGESNTANSYMSWFGGRFSTLFTGQSTNSWVATDILFNIGNGTGGSSRSNALSLFKNGRLELPSYGDGTFTGTATKLLAVDADGKVIEEDLPTSESVDWDAITGDQSDISLGGFTNDVGFTTNTGTVTSVAISGSDGIEVDSGSPVTGSGTIVLGINASSLRSHINVEDGAQVNVKADWNSVSGDSEILNKPTLVTEFTGLSDTPANYSGQGGKAVAVNSGGTALEFVEFPDTTPFNLVVDDGDEEVSNVNKINFVGATVTDNEDGSVDVEYSTTQTVKQAKVTITPAQMATLGDNPITIIPAQGAKTVINPISGSFYLDFNTTPYDISSSMGFAINTDGILNIGSVTINSASTTYTSMTRTGFVSSNQENQPLLLATVSNPTQGDSDITIIITYTVDNFN